jgi:hypothetical protein
MELFSFLAYIVAGIGSFFSWRQHRDARFFHISVACACLIALSLWYYFATTVLALSAFAALVNFYAVLIARLVCFGFLGMTIIRLFYKSK